MLAAEPARPLRRHHGLIDRASATWPCPCSSSRTTPPARARQMASPRLTLAGKGRAQRRLRRGARGAGGRRPRRAPGPAPGTGARPASAGAVGRRHRRAQAGRLGALDFDDLELEALAAAGGARPGRSARPSCESRFSEVRLVDEFQDTNALQSRYRRPRLDERLRGALRGRRRAPVDLPLPRGRRRGLPPPAGGGARGRGRHAGAHCPATPLPTCACWRRSTPCSERRLPPRGDEPLHSPLGAWAVAGVRRAARWSSRWCAVPSGPRGGLRDGARRRGGLDRGPNPRTSSSTGACRAGDVAILFEARTDAAVYEAALAGGAGRDGLGCRPRLLRHAGRRRRALPTCG